jgi:pimeloyl-ACP methyl ester carboxylesterase
LGCVAVNECATLKENDVMKLAKQLLVLLLTFPLVLATASSVFGETPPEFFVDETKLPFDALPGTDTERLWGIHNNAGYRIEVPANWNGDLVVWAHGFNLGLELIVYNPPIPLRQYFVSNGYAWAASSFSRNNYNVDTGAIDSHALTKRFNGLVGRPDRVYVMGASMGGHIATVMAEQWPNTYDGAMPCCGTMGDYEHINFYADFNLAAQALTGVETGYPLPQDYMTEYVNPVIKPALGEVEIIPGFTLPWFYAPNETGEKLIAFTEIQSGGERPVFDQGFLYWNLITGGNYLFSNGVNPGNWVRTQGVAFDNMDRIYQLDSDPALTIEEEILNETIFRVSRDPQGIHPNGLANVPVVSGDIKVPVLTLHTLGDFIVPFSMQQFYAERVAENGAEDLLVQRAIRDYGHCSFTAEEFIAGFADLVNWVENGVKPAGDDVLDPAIVAHPDYGCNFTNPDRNGFIEIPACP